MKDGIILKYENGASLLELTSEYRIGKKKLRSILTENGITINKKGGKTKNNIIDFDISFLDDKNVKCNYCEKTFSDSHNKSGALTSHISSCQPHIEIPSQFKRSMFLKTTGNYWHMQYFSVEDKQEKQLFNCPLCDYKTPDLDNKTGAITKHIQKNHGTILEFNKKFPGLNYLFNKQISHLNRKEEFESDENSFVVCQICEQKMVSITETHLAKHSTNLEEYRKNYPKSDVVSNNLKETIKNNIINSEYNPEYRSKGEIELFEFVQSIDNEAIRCDKKTLSGIELDILCKKHNIAIEYNGLFWHSEKQGKNKNYHLDKTEMCLKKGIRLIHIFSDEWECKKEIVKSRLLHLFGQDTEKIYARKCEIKQLESKTKSAFLNEYHLQGDDKSNISYGLYHNGELVSVATFGKLRVNLGHKNRDTNNWELYRFCGKNVVGGFSKLLKKFIKENNPQKIITYSDRNWSPSPEHSFYGKVGFSFLSYTKPNYYYMLKYKKRENRFNYRKSVLISKGFDANKTEREIMFENGYDVIWDCGNLKYEMTIDNKGV